MQLKNTLTNRIEPVEQELPFSLYCCGPTVYGPAHIGNFRAFVLQDVLRRVLEIAGYNPTHVRNITDVDDKTILRSQAEGVSLKKFTEKWTHRFQEDAKKLNLLAPHFEPKATEYIQEQIALIETLIHKNLAYKTEDGSVYFNVSAFKDYGKLSKLDASSLQTQEENSAGKTNDVDEYDRENVRDFALWKAHKASDGDVAWDSPWGKGRPGWHTECSAMSTKLLGKTITLHAGGIDLIFPHHENEIAQSEGATGKKFAKHWFHNAHLNVDGKKMSKSFGNLYTLDDLQQKGFEPMDVRYLLLSGHYSHPLNFTLEGLNSARSALHKLQLFAIKLLEKAELESVQLNTTPTMPFKNWNFFKNFWEGLQNDLNTPMAIGQLFSAIAKTNPESLSRENATALIKELNAALFCLGLSLHSQEKSVEIPPEIQALADQRWSAKQNKNFTLADQLRNQLESNGWKSLDTKDSYSLTRI